MDLHLARLLPLCRQLKFDEQVPSINPWAECVCVCFFIFQTKHTWQTAS